METPRAAGRYRIERLLGSGGFAAVWLGHDPELDSPVAIKILGEHWTHRADVRERFVREARLLRQADSHRLVQVFDIGELPDERPYFVMSYADLGTLEERLAGGPLPLNEALRTAREIILGVRELHELGVVHRDLKPSNVLLRSAPGGGERIMIADLGIARSGDRLSSLTLPAGSPGYMAPEQAQIDGAPDQRADVYGLGALTHHLLTGEPPRTPAAPPSALQPAIPPGVDRAVLRALEPDRERRWASAAEFGHALTSATSRIDTDPLPDPLPPRTARARRPGRPRRAVLAGAGAAVAALVAGGAFWILGGADGGSASGTRPQERWLRAGSDVPRQYRELIVRAGTWCDMRGLSPALIAAMLKAESGFDPRLADPARDEYGIARWTPKVLVFWQPGGLNNPEPKPADITPELSIPAMGRFLCYWGKDLKDVPGDPSLNLAATYRSSSKKVVEAGGVPEKYRPYAERVQRYMQDYRPR
ncbi:serine/threonine-protein kinase [Actinomadura rubrisoli]|uniref:non-specific serine/threonine protein kinase n=1 Tax=Actinomadura rubrisoli TaxID=2530368 RepID=A0A4V2YXU2_9ACTN|nr:serine/threonine-protein kinase [Actinomadura rubrisoli]TDD90117.1 serine/threonine protein kinase [Actinomadura rubrisoli]